MKVSKEGSCEEKIKIAVEKIYELKFGDEISKKLSASPSYLKEFVIGHAFTENIINDLNEINSIKIDESSKEINIDLVDEKRELDSGKGSEKSGEDDVFSIERDKIFDLRPKLDTELHDETGGVHTSILYFKEDEYIISDVGRHNTFDKVIGKALMEEIDLSHSLLFSTARQSESMVKKAGRAGIPIVATIAAPLTSGIKEAEKNDQTLIGLVGEESFFVFTGDERVDF